VVFLSSLQQSQDIYIHGSVHRDSILIISNEMQQYAGCLFTAAWRKVVALTLGPVPEAAFTV